MVNLLHAFLGQIVVQGVVLADAVDGVGHSVDVPVIDLDDVAKYLAAAALLRDDGRTAALHGFEGSDAEGFADAGHHEDVAVLVALIDLLASLEAREVAAVGYAVAGGQLYHGVHHVAAACKAEADVAAAFKHSLGGFEEVLGAFLHRDATQIRHHLLALLLVGHDVANLFVERIDRIVHGYALAGVLMILMDDGLSGQLAYAHDAVGVVHAVLLDAIDGGVHLAARAVEVCGVNVDAERLAAHHLGMNASGIGEPVVRMDEVELLAPCQHAGDDGEVVDFFMQVARIAPGKADAAHVVEALQVVEVGIEVVAEAVVVLCRMAYEAVLDVVVPHVAPNDGYLAHVNYLEELLLLSRWFRHTEGRLDVSLQAQSLGDAIGSHCKAAVYLGRKLPSEH